MKRLLIVDDHPVFRNGLRLALEDAPEYDGIVEAGSGAEALAELESGYFDMAIIDVGLPDISGFDILEARAREAGSPRFFVLTMSADPSLARKALRYGASGFASKNLALGTLLLALRLVDSGELYVEGEILRDILTAELRFPRARSEQYGKLEKLTERERAVLDALLEGCNAKEVAGRLGVSQRTAENYQSAVYAKLGARTAVELVRMAISAGICPAG
ncbi:MAG: hypothetical protein CVV51_06425 [Spirochaetae bacterium HGW-Spirochaetae-7]|jgi:DNA-binding NarL/FixJ family response regulator|nr:MAG: hypothetical protein CVV51_06425 [Spirochaetae bacterium HGW-Spirochaetae-7]